MTFSNLWTEGDEELLVRLDRQNPMLKTPQLLKVLNEQASRPRPLNGLRTKLLRLKAGRADQPSSRPHGHKQPRITGTVKPDAASGSDYELEGGFSREMSPARTVISTDDDDQVDQLASTNSGSATPVFVQAPRPASHVPATPHSHHSRPRHSPTQPATQRGKKHAQPSTGGEGGGAVTEVQAIETVRELVKVMGKLSEMERAYLERHGVGA